MRARHSMSGLTLIELVVGILVTSIATTTLLLLVAGNIGRSADPLIIEQASAIAQAYVEEIGAKPFCDPDFAATGCPAACTVSACSGGCGGAVPAAETRGLYDDICDYQGLPDNTVRDQSGAPIPALAQYTVAVSVTDSGVSLGPAGAELNADSGQLLRINVTVDHPAADPVTLTTYRANY